METVPGDPNLAKFTTKINYHGDPSILSYYFLKNSLVIGKKICYSVLEWKCSQINLFNRSFLNSNISNSYESRLWSICSFGWGICSWYTEVCFVYTCMVHICVLVSALGACTVYVCICVHVCSHMWHMHLYDVHSSHWGQTLLAGARLHLFCSHACRSAVR